MRDTDISKHWEEIYLNRSDEEVSWTEKQPEMSIRMLSGTGLERGDSVIDVGGGNARLVDWLLTTGLRPGILDLSAHALQRSRTRLGPKAHDVEWIHSPVETYRPETTWDGWHDRALFHFMVEESERRAYLASLKASLRPGGVAVIAGFGPDGPRSCSGLPVRRLKIDELEQTLGPGFELLEWSPEEHRTPWGSLQSFVYALFRRKRPIHPTTPQGSP